MKEYIRPDHLNPYGLRKGSATHATSGTTVPPPLTSVFFRGEWSMGVVQDIYWKFCQVMTCLDPNSTNFDALPPHFTQGLENTKISKAFDLCFKNVIRAINENYMNNFTGFLLRCLASKVYHADNLLRVARSNPIHPFNSIAILNDGATLVELKSLVTIKKSSKISIATGVPPHVETLKNLDFVVKLLLEERSCRKKWEENFASTLTNTINEFALDAGQITRPKMVEITEQHTRGLNEIFKDDMEDIIRKCFPGNFSYSDNSADPSY